MQRSVLPEVLYRLVELALETDRSDFDVRPVGLHELAEDDGKEASGEGGEHLVDGGDLVDVTE